MPSIDAMLITFDGRSAGGIAIYQLPDANALDVAKRVNDKMAELSKNFPPGLSYSVPFDTTRFVRSAIGEVRSTAACSRP